MEPQPDPQSPEPAGAAPVRRARKRATPVTEPVVAVVAVVTPAVAKPRAGKYTFTLTDNDVALIAALKQRSAGIGPMARKSDIVRAALHLLGCANAEDFAESLGALSPIERKKKP